MISDDSSIEPVLDRRFKVMGTKNLRVVDASVFPKIPGLFIALPIMIMSEKAADIIVSSQKAST